MSCLSNTLENIWKRKDDFCCLCFSSLPSELIYIGDEVFVPHNDTDNIVPVFEVFAAIFENKILDYMFTFKYVCRACTQSAIFSYNFIKTCKFNTGLMTNTINGLSTSVEHTESEMEHYSTLFVSLSTTDFTSKQYLDVRKPFSSLTMAHRRYNLLVNSTETKPKHEVDVSSEPVKIEPANEEHNLHPNGVLPMRMKDMVFDINESIIRCKECLKVYTALNNLRNHFIKVHAPKIYKCSECKKSFGSPSLLEAHSNEHCVIVCSECGKTFKNKQTFKSHEMNHYMRLLCQNCGRVYKNKATYQKHIELKVCGQKSRASPSNAKFTCDYCNKKYTQKVSLRVHIQYEHGNYKYHICNVCNKKFWAQSRLKAHMVKHTKERKFNCTLCDGTFVTKEALLYHTRIHTGEKPYECPGCDAKFLSASRRTEHVKRHHKNATLKCDVCGSKFNSLNYLRKHRKGHFNTGSVESPPNVCKDVTPEKVNDIDFKKFTQELKEMSHDDFNINEHNETDIFLEFTKGEFI